MAIVTTIIEALRKFGTSTQRSAIERQDEQLANREVLERQRYVARSELGSSAQFLATTKPVPENVALLTDEELAPILENATLITKFVAAFSSDSDSDMLLDQMDSAFRAWTESDDKRGYTDDAVIEIAGAAFGKFCADRLDMRWVRVTDDLGSAIAVQGRVVDFRGYPYAAIAKRIPKREHGFFKAIFIGLEDASRRDWALPGAT